MRGGGKIFVNGGDVGRGLGLTSSTLERESCRLSFQIIHSRDEIETTGSGRRSSLSLVSLLASSLLDGAISSSPLCASEMPLIRRVLKRGCVSFVDDLNK